MDTISPELNWDDSVEIVSTHVDEQEITFWLLVVIAL